MPFAVEQLARRHLKQGEVVDHNGIVLAQRYPKSTCQPALGEDIKWYGGLLPVR